MAANAAYPGYPPGFPSLTQQPGGTPAPGAPTTWPHSPHLPPTRAKNPIRAVWWGAERSPTWGIAPAGAPVDVVRQGVISSPVFDLRPDLRHSQGSPSPAVPIYRPAGGGYLYLQISRIQDAVDQLTSLEVTSTERGHVSRADLVQVISEPEDITALILPTAQAVIIPIQPPGSGFNVRYWACDLRFNVLINKPDPTLTIWMSFY